MKYIKYLILIAGILGVIAIASMANASVYTTVFTDSDIIIDGYIVNSTYEYNISAANVEVSTLKFGFVEWDISSIPANAVITGVALIREYSYTLGGADDFFIRNITNRPSTTGDPRDVYHSTGSVSFMSGVTGCAAHINSTGGVGTQNWVISPIPHLQAAVSNSTGYFAFGFINGKVSPFSPILYFYSANSTGHTKPLLWVRYETISPSITTEYPLDSATHIMLTPKTNVSIVHPLGTAMNITWRWYNDSSLAWEVYGYNGSVTNGTYANHLIYATEPCKDYYWWVYVEDIYGNYTEEVFSFSTHCPAPPTNLDYTRVNDTAINITFTPDDNASSGTTYTLIYYLPGYTAPGWGEGTLCGNTSGSYVVVDLEEGECYSFAAWTYWNGSYFYSNTTELGIINVTYLDNGSAVRGSWHDGTYVYSLHDTEGLYAYSYNGATLTYKANIDNGSYCRGLYGDGTYIYAACADAGIKAYSFDGSTFTFKGSIDNGAGEVTGIWCSGGYIYAACGADGLRAYTFDGTTFTLKDTQDDGDVYWDVWGDGTYIYTACGASGLRAYTFAADAFSAALDTQQDGVGDKWSVIGAGSYIYASSVGDGIRAYTFTAVGGFVLKDTQDDGGNYRCVGVFGPGLPVAVSSTGIFSYSFNGDFALLNSFATGGLNPTYYNIFCNSTTAFVPCYNDGLFIYSRNYTMTNVSESTWLRSTVSTEGTFCTSGGEYTIAFFDEETFSFINFTRNPYNCSTAYVILHYFDTNVSSTYEVNNATVTWNNTIGSYTINVNTVGTISYFELVWNAEHNESCYNNSCMCYNEYASYTRNLFPESAVTDGVNNYIVFYIANRSVYGEYYTYGNTSYYDGTFDSSVVQYTYTFADLIGNFATAPPNDASLTVWAFNTTGKIIIHQEYWSAAKLCHPYLIYNKQGYFLSVNCSTLKLNNIGMAENSQNINPLIYITQTDTSTAAVLTTLNVKFNWDSGSTGIWLSYSDDNLAMPIVNLTLINRTSGAILGMREVTANSYNFSGPGAWGTFASANKLYSPYASYALVITVTRSGSRFNATYMIYNFSLDKVTADHINDLLTQIFGLSPIFNVETGEVVPYTSIIIFLVSLFVLFALLPTSESFAFIGGGGVMVFLTALISGESVGFYIIGVLVIVLGIFIMLSGRNR